MKNIYQRLLENRRPIQLAISVLATGLVLWIIINSRDDLARLVSFQLWNIVSILIVYILQFIAAAIPLWLIIKNISGKSVPVINWIKIMIISRMANFMVPKSGGLYKAFVLKNDYKVSYTDFIYVYSFFSWLTILLNLALVYLLISIFFPTLRVGDYSVMPIIAIMLIATLCAPLVIKYILDLIKPRDTLLAKISAIIHGIFTVMNKHGCNVRFMSKLTGLLIIQFCLNVLLFQLIFYGMNVEIGYAQMSLFIAAQQVSIIIFITPGNIGVRELLYGGIGGAVGIGVTEGIIASAILRAAAYLVVFPFGIVFSGSGIYHSIIPFKRSGVDK